MATNAEITAAVCDAIVGGVSTNAQRDKFAKIVYAMNPLAPAYETLTTAQKLAVIPTYIRQMGRDLVRRYNQAQYAAKAEADVSTEFGPP